jgi:hypothetical protein
LDDRDTRAVYGIAQAWLRSVTFSLSAGKFGRQVRDNLASSTKRLDEVVDDGLLVVVTIADEHATGCHDAELPVYDL